MKTFSVNFNFGGDKNLLICVISSRVCLKNGLYSGMNYIKSPVFQSRKTTFFQFTFFIVKMVSRRSIHFVCSCYKVEILLCVMTVWQYDTSILIVRMITFNLFSNACHCLKCSCIMNLQRTFGNRYFQSF